MALPTPGAGDKTKPWEGIISSGKADNYQGKEVQHFHRYTAVLAGKSEVDGAGCCSQDT